MHDRTLFPRRDLLVVVAAAILLRVLHWVLFSQTPFFRHPVVDGSFFDLWAQSIAAGEPARDDVWFKPPLYAYWLALVYRVMGHAPVVAYVLQSLMGVATAVLTLGIGRLAFTPRIALVGAMTAGLLPILPFLELQLLAESLTILLTTAALLVLLLARDGDRWRTGWLAAAGLLLGVAATGRPNVLLFVPLALLWAWSRTPGPATQRLRPASILVVAVVVALTPTTVRNVVAGRSLVPVSANLGINLWTGVMPGADGTSPIHVGLHWRDAMLRSHQAGADTPDAASAYYARQARQAMARDPLRTVGLIGRKAVLLVGAQEVRNNVGPRFLASEYGVVTLHRWWPGFWLIAPLALIGLVQRRRDPDGARLLMLYLLAIALSILPFFVNARFRAPMLPVIALFAAAGWDGLMASWRAGGSPRRLALIGLAVAALLVNVPWFATDPDRDRARDHYNLAMAYSARLAGEGQGESGPDWRAQDPDLARAHLERALALDPDEADYHAGMGQLLLQQAMPTVIASQQARQRGDRARADQLFATVRSQVEAAAEHHAEAGRLMPRAYRSLASAGLAQIVLAEAAPSPRVAADHLRQAIAMLEASQRVVPGYPGAVSNLALARDRLATLESPNVER